MTEIVATWLLGGVPILALALIGWVCSVFKEKVHLVDSLWSIFFVSASLVYYWQAYVT